MLVNERVLIIYPSDLFSVEFSSGISTVLKHYKNYKVPKYYDDYCRLIFDLTVALVYSRL